MLLLTKTVNDSLAHFYPRDAMLAQVIAIATSVCPSVCYAPVLWLNEES